MTKTQSVKRNTKAGLAVFIDLLGFSQKVKSVNTFEELAEVKKQIDVAHNYFEIGKKDAFRKKYLKVTGQSDFALSDSIFSFIPLQSEVMKYTDEFGAVMSDLAGIAYSQMSCVLNNVFIRGGVSLGWFYRDKNNFISDALVEAVYLEKKVCYPLICVSNAIIERYKNSKERKYYSESLDPFHTDFFITVDVGNINLHCINYLHLSIEAVSPYFTEEEKKLQRQMSPEEAQQFENKKYWQAQAECLINHKEAIELGIESAPGNKRAIDKYKWLVKYHNSIAEPFKQINPNVIIKGRRSRK